ncbi:nucleotidyltransferase domain-containing protein [Infirmifilum lucidum]|uniref:Nucleotidyltransferase domain-containing protein n=1 Tax=Infirmifilum lucidum TaxID=2776706 RepID=A0A7L9FIV1_9CREN|nr:nucleotidyltransferase domain-containing protein [Infirmifilum lucidum]QOJ78715.1 nucleotidyltransferase domain-containing protein [Infirmifilum lucidum]
MDLIDALKEFNWEKYNVEFAVFYGSQARGVSDPLSDIDIAVKGGVDLVDLILALSDYLSVPEDRIDVPTVNDEIPYSLLYTIATQSILLYAREFLLAGVCCQSYGLVLGLQTIRGESMR